MKDLRSLLVEMSSNWLKRRKAQAPVNVKTIDVTTFKAAPRLAERTTRQRPSPQAQTEIHPRRRLQYVSLRMAGEGRPDMPSS